MVITIGGQPETIHTMEDLAYHIDKHMGMEVREALVCILNECYVDADELEEMEERHEKDLDEIREHYNNALLEIQEEAEMLSDLLTEPRLDRKKIIRCAENISWKAVAERG